MKVITVIIAAYRAEAFILDAIHSVLSQQLPEQYCVQFLLGIDGCEPTKQTVSGISDKRMQVLVMDKNYGTYITFNSLIPFAKGDLILRFDADDIMLSGYLSKQIEIFEQHPDVSLTWTLNRYIDTEGHGIPCESADDESEPPPYWKIRSASNGQFMIRKEILTILGGFKPWPCNGDTDFLFRMRFLGLKEHGIQEALYLRRIHPDSLTQSHTTGYDSEIRRKYREIMLREKNERSSRPDKADCRVEPLVGQIVEQIAGEIPTQIKNQSAQ